MSVMIVQPTILLAHGELTAHAALAQSLASAGMGCARATSASECLRLIAEHSPAVVLVDQELPGGDSLALCRSLHGAPSPQAPLVILLTTGAAAPGADYAGVADMWLAPPYCPEQLLALIRLLLRIHTVERQQARLPYERIVQTALEGFWIVEAGTAAFLAVNDAYCRMSGYSRAELLTMRVADVEAIESPEDVAARAERVRRQGYDRFESRHRRKDGTFFDVEVSVRYIEAEEALAVVFARDITASRQADESLRRSEARYRSLLNAVPDRVFRHDSHGNFIDFHNPRDLPLIMTPDSFLGKHYSQVVPPAISEPFTATIARARQSGQVERFEYDLPGPDGALLSFEARLIIGDDQDMVVIVRDITERKQAESARERLSKELARKNHELEQIVYVASHDLRSPLVNVQGFSRELQTSLSDLRRTLAAVDLPAEQRARINFLAGQDIPESLSYILTGVNKMDALLKGLLRLSRLGRAALRIEPLDVGQIVAETLMALDFQIKRVGARVERGPLPPCRGDAVQVGQIFANLVDNALKYLAPGRPGLISISGHCADGMAVYCVADNGVGIAPAHLEKIFELYYRLEPTQSEGEGLGLTIVRTIADRHGGWVRATSMPSGGSQFIVALPEAL